MRNNKGQFVLGRTETAQEKEKRIDASKVAWKEREDYIGDLRFSPLYNVWRSFKFTEKGRKAGYSKEWNDFKAFFKDMSGGYCKGFRLGRLDKSQPFSKDNCKWMTESELSVTRNNTIVLEHNGEKRH